MKIAYNSNTYEENILTKDGVDILAKNGDNYGQPSLAASTSFTTLNPEKPNVGGIGSTGVTPHGGMFGWYGFSVNEGATIDHYEYSLDN